MPLIWMSLPQPPQIPQPCSTDRDRSIYLYIRTTQRTITLLWYPKFLFYYEDKNVPDIIV